MGFSGIFPRPCRKVRARGWRGWLGVVSPSRVLHCCPHCDRLTKCKWAVSYACRSGGKSATPKESVRARAKKLRRRIRAALFRLRIKMFVRCQGISCSLFLKEWKSSVNVEALFLTDMAVVKLEVPSQVLKEAGNDIT